MQNAYIERFNRGYRKEILDAHLFFNLSGRLTCFGNIKQEISYGQGKLQTRYGTKQFSPGTKVYIIDWYAGMCQDITVIGLSRDTKKLITIVIRAEWIENFRVKLCYNPKVCSKIKAYFDKEETGLQSYTEKFVNDMFIGIPQWNEPN